MPLKSTTHREGDRVRCPYCSSPQVRSMISQPEKFPNPTPNAFECQNCGREFVSIPMYTSSVLTHGVPNSPNHAQRNTTRVKWSIVIVALLVAVTYSWFKQPQQKTASNKPASTKSSSNTANNYSSSSKTAPVAGSQVAETSAQHHVEKPSHNHPQKNKDTISHSQNPEDTLSIKIESTTTNSMSKQQDEHSPKAP